MRARLRGYLQVAPLTAVFGGFFVLPIMIVIMAALFGFTLSYDEIAQTSQTVGALHTLPLELQALQTNATTPVIYALGTLTTALSLGVILCCLLVVLIIQHRRTRPGDVTVPGRMARL